MIRLETASRYYLYDVHQNLFGEWELYRAWGAKSAPLGNSMRQVATDQAHAQQLLALVLKRKQRPTHGYVIVSGSPRPTA